MMMFLRQCVRIAVLGVALITSLLLIAGLVFGPIQVSKDQSRYRLSKYYETSVNEVSRLNPIWTETKSGRNVPVENAVPLEDGWYQGVLVGPSFVELDNIPLLQGGGKVVTEVIINVPIDSLLDTRIVHWKTPALSDYSDDNFYKYPITVFSEKQTLYIDGDIERLRIMPTVRRGERFKVVSISMKKYRLPPQSIRSL